MSLSSDDVRAVVREELAGWLGERGDVAELITRIRDSMGVSDYAPLPPLSPTDFQGVLPNGYIGDPGELPPPNDDGVAASPSLGGYMGGGGGHRTSVDRHIRIPDLRGRHAVDFDYQAGSDPQDQETLLIVDVAASRRDITVEIYSTNLDGSPHATITGPWLTGHADQSFLRDMLSIAIDAAREKRELSALEVMTQAFFGDPLSPLARLNNGSILRPVVVPVRAMWRVRVRLNEGGQPGPADVWIRMFQVRPVY